MKQAFADLLADKTFLKFLAGGVVILGGHVGLGLDPTSTLELVGLLGAAITKDVLAAHGSDAAAATAAVAAQLAPAPIANVAVVTPAVKS
jgi:hypothetical protein